MPSQNAEVCVDVDVEKPCNEISKELNSIKQGRVIIMVGDIEVEYYGRAASHAPLGTRLIIVKLDGALLIHESCKREPLNWQPPGAHVVFECVGQSLRLRSIRMNPREEVIVDFKRVHFAKACRLAQTKLLVIGTEEDLVRILISNPKIVHPDAQLVGRDVATPYGKVDVLLRRKDGTLIVVEVKNERAGIAAVAQLKRYVEYYRSQGMSVEGVLVAPSLSEDAKTALLKEGFRFIDAKSLSPRPTTSLEKYFRR